jgi:hypothetical protein
MTSKLLYPFVFVLLISFQSCELEELTPSNYFQVAIPEAVYSGEIYSDIVLTVPDSVDLSISNQVFELKFTEGTGEFVGGVKVIDVVYSRGGLKIPFRSTTSGLSKLTVKPKGKDKLSQDFLIEFIQPSSSDIFSYELSSNDPVPANNQSEVEIIVVLGDNLELSSIPVSFVTSKGTFQNDDDTSSAQFDLDRQCSARLKSNSPGIAEVKVAYGAYSYIFNVPFSAISGSDIITISTDGNTLVADGVSLLPIHISVAAFQQGQSNQVSLSTNFGSFNSGNVQENLTLNSLGEATALLKSSDVGSAMIVASYSNWSTSTSVEFLTSFPDYIVVNSVTDISNSSLRQLNIRLNKFNGGTCSIGLPVAFSADTTAVFFTNIEPSQSVNNEIIAKAQFWHADPEFTGTVSITATTVNGSGNQISVSYPVVFD